MRDGKKDELQLCGNCATFRTCFPQRLKEARAKGWTMSDEETKKLIANSIPCLLWKKGKKA